LINPYRFGGPPVTPVSPGLTNLIAWYDFADATDADGNTYPLDAQNTPTYTAGPPSYGTATDGTPLAYWRQTALGSNFGNTSGEWSMVLRFRAHTAITNGDVVFASNGGRWKVEWSTTAIQGLAASLVIGDEMTSTVGGSIGTWYTVVLTHSASAGTSSISVNGTDYVTDSSLTATYNTGLAHFGAANTTNSQNVDIDFAGFWGKTLSQSNVAWLYNTAGTRLYSEL
jgi:hypothetical protein